MVHRTDTERSPATACGAAGAFGAPIVTGSVAFGAPVPIAFTAATVNVYEDAFDSPSTSREVIVGDTVRAACTTPSFVGVTMNAVIAAPLAVVGANQLTCAPPFTGDAHG